ncbi:hypothetical protein N7495_005787 [Penicillium taxi]|uniref:uncharacterized protein n=1 Tax=Penicillium taxi TaxID=168475 RepID=UPI0025453696|nr:uncharacterized protein N7495_005787 [Penicillium taxi]KAJ5894096.1 hypothetical protein N7495_005787 [Penicillium taxi]
MSALIATPTRLSPVQQLQRSPYTDIYTNAPITPLRSRTNVQHLNLTVSHAHPEPRRWKNPGGWGARHINDTAPFTLWNEKNRQFRLPSREELIWIQNKFGEGTLTLTWFMSIVTACPPQPVPLTVGTMPVIFIRPGETLPSLIPSSGYSNPRIPDPCPDLHWPRMALPTKSQQVEYLEALEQLANVRAVMFLPYWTILELDHRDGRLYGKGSLPGVVAGRTALYHHAEAPFFTTMRSQTRARFINPLQQINGSCPQDDSNYLRRARLTPGCRVECGFGSPGTSNESYNCATSSGVKIRNSVGQEALTVAHHGFLTSNAVFHPRVNGDQIGQIFHSLPELDIAFVRLTPTTSANFTNSCYFQAEPPTKLIDGYEIQGGSWSEVDGMSSGLISLMASGRQMLRPIRPAGHPEISYAKWDTRIISLSFGAVNEIISDGICGAPIVDVETAGVVGFFHLFDGTFALHAHIDELIAEGWNLI